MRLFNTVVLLFIGLPAAFFFAYQQGWLDPYVEEDWIPAGPLIQAELRATVSPEEIEARIAAALEEDDYADAQLYAEIADYASIPLSDETRAALDDANSLTNNIRRTGGSFFEGFVYGRGSDTASFMGALTSDLTVIGDVRDLRGKAKKWCAVKTIRPSFSGSRLQALRQRLRLSARAAPLCLQRPGSRF